MSLGVLRGIWKYASEAGEALADEPTGFPPLPERKPDIIDPDAVTFDPTGDMPWIKVAKSIKGIEEWSGPSDNPKIIAWAKEIGGDTARDYRHDSIPWCGLYVGYCIHMSGLPIPGNPLWALNWAKWEESVEPGYGAVMSFRRNGGGHVGFYMSEDKYAYHILGGNQSDEVNVSRVRKSQFVAARWPSVYMPYYRPGRIYKDFDGKLTTSSDLQ